MMFAALCPNMAMAESADAVSFGYVEKELKIIGGGRNEKYLIGLYSFDSPALREKLKSFYSNEQQYLVPHKLFIAQHKREEKKRGDKDWWFAVKYELNGVARCGYMEDTDFYTKMTSIISNLNSKFLNDLALSKYKSDNKDDNPLAQSEEMTALLENRFNVKRDSSGWPDSVDANSEYSSKKEIVTALFEDCNENEFIDLKDEQGLSDLQEELLTLASQPGDSYHEVSSYFSDESIQLREILSKLEKMMEAAQNPLSETAQISQEAKPAQIMQEDVLEKVMEAVEQAEASVIKANAAIRAADLAIQQMKRRVETAKSESTSTRDPAQALQASLKWFKWLAALMTLLIIVFAASGFWFYRQKAA